MPALGLFTTIDPKSEDYYFQSPYVYAANDPIKFIDQNGESPTAIAIGGGVVISAADAALIATGVVASGIILHEAQDGSLKLNSNIKNLFSKKKNGGFREQQTKTKQLHNEMLEKYVGKRTPDGGNTPKGGGNLIGRIVTGIGLEETARQGITKYMNKSQNRDFSTKQENNKGEAQNSKDDQDSENKSFKLPTYTMPADNTRVNQPLNLNKDDKRDESFY
jgi:hypothetical protein